MLLALLLACTPSPDGPPAEAPVQAPVAPITAVEAVAPVDPVRASTTVVFFGDSLTAGYGLSPDQAYPALLGRMLGAQGLPITVVNAGVSGDTTAGGRARLDWTLRQHPDVFVLALGGNDMLRGLPPEEARANLRDIATRARDAGATVVLAGMKANPSLGPDYVAAFDAIYPDLAKELGAPLLPFLLDGVAGNADLTQADGIHPTAEGQARLAALLLPLLEPVIRTRQPAR